MSRLKGDSGREPFELVIIKQDLCVEEYGVAACTAAIGVTGLYRCYNTRKTCQDAANYDKSGPGKGIFLARPQAGVIPIIAGAGLPAFPYLASISTSPGRINPGGRVGTSGSLGKRASVTIKFTDHPHSDNYVDPYVASRTWDPLERGTFWSKWLVRNPYHANWTVEVITGYLDPDGWFGSIVTKAYVIDKIEGPDAQGRVTLRASDILRLADNDKSQCPAPSTGELSADLTDSANTFIALNTAAGDYPTIGGILRVGDEIMTYGSGIDSGSYFTFISVGRGKHGTDAAAHDAEATVQLCVNYSGAAWAVAQDLLENYGNITPGYIDGAAWQAESDRWLSGFVVSRLLSTPIGVAKLVGQLCEQALMYIWWDSKLQKIIFKAVRPPLPSEVVTLTERADLIQGTPALKARPEERITRVWINHGLRSPIHKDDERDSYLFSRLRIDLEVEGDDQYGDSKTYEINAAWLDGSAQVSPLSFRLLARYKDNPRYFTAEIDAKDVERVSPGTVIDIDWRGLVDIHGAKALTRFEVIGLHEVKPGERIRIELQESQFNNRYAYVMENSALAYSGYTDQTRPELSGFACPPAIAGSAQNFPDGTSPYAAQ